MQVHGQDADEAVAGQRTAVNLAGDIPSGLARGMMLAAPDTFATTNVIDAQVRLLASAPRSLKSQSRVHFHCNAMETVAEIVLHESKQIARPWRYWRDLKLRASRPFFAGRSLYHSAIFAGRNHWRRSGVGCGAGVAEITA